MSENERQLQPLGVSNQARGVLSAKVATRSSVLAFGIFELDSATGELRKDGRLIHLRHKAAEVLRILLERAGDMVTRKEITDAIWPDDIDVDVEQGLNHCLREIRAALGDRADSPRYIQTLPRRGYRVLVEVRREPGTPSPSLLTGAPVAGGEPSTATSSPKENSAARDPDSDPGLGDGRFE